MTEVIVKNSLKVIGKYTLVHEDGTKEEIDGKRSFCRCGLSSAMPFCDNTHRRYEGRIKEMLDNEFLTPKDYELEYDGPSLYLKRKKNSKMWKNTMDSTKKEIFRLKDGFSIEAYEKLKEWVEKNETPTNEIAMTPTKNFLRQISERMDREKNKRVEGK